MENNNSVKPSFKEFLVQLYWERSKKMLPHRRAISHFIVDRELRCEKETKKLHRRIARREKLRTRLNAAKSFMTRQAGLFNPQRTFKMAIAAGRRKLGL